MGMLVRAFMHMCMHTQSQRTSILVCLYCYNKTPQTWCPGKKQTFIPHSSGGWRIENQGAGYLVKAHFSTGSLRFCFHKALGSYSANCTLLKGSKIYLMTICKSLQNLRGGMLLELRAVNALCAGKSFPSSWPQALISLAPVMNFSLQFYRDFFLKRAKLSADII